MDNLSSYKEHISFELLTDYADGILDARLSARISTHLKECKECADIVNNIQHYYDTYGNDREGLEDDLEITKKNIITAVDEALMVLPPKPAKVRSLWYYASGIAAAVLLVIAFVLTFNYQSKSAGSLVDGYLSETYHSPPVARGDSDQIMEFWNEVTLQYESKNYTEAITTLELIIGRKETLPMAHFYIGLCNLYLEEPKLNKAIFHFRKVISSENPYYEQGLWYLSLAYFQAERKDLCEKTLSRITSYKPEEVRALLKSISSE